MKSMEELMEELNKSHTEWDEGHKATPVVQAPQAPEEATFVGSQYQAGDEIADNDGNVYVAIQSSYYISDADAADIEDGWDAQISVGWHTLARLKGNSTQVLVEQVQAGQAKIERRGGITHVLFHDENQLIPLNDLAYNSEIGLYQKSKFPDVKD